MVLKKNENRIYSESVVKRLKQFIQSCLSVFAAMSVIAAAAVDVDDAAAAGDDDAAAAAAVGLWCSCHHLSPFTLIFKWGAHRAAPEQETAIWGQGVWWWRPSYKPHQHHHGNSSISLHKSRATITVDWRLKGWRNHNIKLSLIRLRTTVALTMSSSLVIMINVP